MGSRSAKLIVARLWRVVESIQSRRRGVTIQQLVETLGASRATVYRDLQVLEEAGVPLARETVNGEARYVLSRDALPALRPSAVQLAALLLARQMLEPLAGGRLVRELDALIATRNGAPEAAGVHLGRKPAASPTPLIETIDRALRNGRRLRLQYRAASTGKVSWRIVEPAGLRLVDGQVYLIAWDLERRGWRIFKSARITFAHDLNEPISDRPEYDEDALFANAVRVWSADPVEVEVRLGSEVAWLVVEWPLHRAQRIESNSDGSVVVRARVAGLVEALRWVLSWGSNAQVLAPHELRSAVQEELDLALRAYGGTSIAAHSDVPTLGRDETIGVEVVSPKLRRARGSVRQIAGRTRAGGRRD